MKTFLGLDSSTQGLKGILLDGTGILAEESVSFGTDLPEYRSPDGFLESGNPAVVHADPLMWLDALDLLFRKMHSRGIRLDRVCGISGSAQQHGSVYLNAGFAGILKHLDPGKTLAVQLKPALSRRTSPIWMDHSTSGECRRLAEHFGSALQQTTGSAATERFTGPQIMKFARMEPEAWRATETVHLVSSFLCSVLCGRSAPVDWGDGAGMNLLNLKTLQWDRPVAAFTAPGLPEKLPPAVPSATAAGFLAPYFRKYGFAEDVPVAVWSGDNPCSLAGLGVFEEGVTGISLGTSDTVFAPMREFRTDPAGYGHVFGNPAGGFFALICFANGSLARERLRKTFGMTRQEWEAVVQAGEPASGRFMLPYFEPECTPSVARPCTRCNFRENAETAETVRALLETQVLSMKHHADWMGGTYRKIRLTGGASRSAALTQIVADVFQTEVELLESSNAAALGAAMCAMHAVERVSFAELAERFCRPRRTIHPDHRLGLEYGRCMERLAAFLRECLG